jgi:hypothetical protein
MTSDGLTSEAVRRIGSILQDLAGSEFSFKISLGSQQKIEVALWSAKAIAKIPVLPPSTVLTRTDEQLEAWLRPYVDGLRS